MEFRNGSAWCLVLLIGILCGLLGYTVAKNAAPPEAKADSLESILAKKEAEYAALSPSLNEQIQKILHELNAEGKKGAEKVFFRYEREIRHESKVVNGQDVVVQIPVESIVAQQFSTDLEILHSEIQHSAGGINYPYKVQLQLKKTRHDRQSRVQLLKNDKAVDKLVVAIHESPLRNRSILRKVIWGVPFEEEESDPVPEHMKTLAAKAEAVCKTVVPAAHISFHNVELRFSVATKKWEYSSSLK